MVNAGSTGRIDLGSIGSGRVLNATGPGLGRKLSESLAIKTGHCPGPEARDGRRATPVWLQDTDSEAPRPMRTAEIEGRFNL